MELPTLLAVLIGSYIPSDKLVNLFEAFSYIYSIDDNWRKLFLLQYPILYRKICDYKWYDFCLESWGSKYRTVLKLVEIDNTAYTKCLLYNEIPTYKQLSWPDSKNYCNMFKNLGVPEYIIKCLIHDIFPLTKGMNFNIKNTWFEMDISSYRESEDREYLNQCLSILKGYSVGIEIKFRSIFIDKYPEMTKLIARHLTLSNFTSKDSLYTTINCIFDKIVFSYGVKRNVRQYYKELSKEINSEILKMYTLYIHNFDTEKLKRRYLRIVKYIQMNNYI